MQFINIYFTLLILISILILYGHHLDKQLEYNYLAFSIKILILKGEFCNLRSYFYRILNSSLATSYYVKKAHASFDKFAQKVHRMKWNDMQCQNSKCDKRRKDVDNFYKCKRCRVCRYCCSWCQKYDWKLYHKSMCKKLKKLRKGNHLLCLRLCRCPDIF